jgi:predicted nucleic acid-binding protein
VLSKEQRNQTHNIQDIDTSTPDILDVALDLLLTAKGQSPSFVDCLVMVYADVCKTTEIFGFDETFAKNGYRLPEAPKEEQAA